MEGLEAVESNGVTAYLQPELKEMLTAYGGVTVDYITHFGRSGYVVRTGQPGGECSPDACASCG